MKKCSLLLLAFLLGHLTFAQEGTIIYTDFEPDIRKLYCLVCSNGRVTFDLDQDGVDEWKFTCMGGYHNVGGFYLNLGPNVNNAHPLVDTLGYHRRFCVAELDYGDTIANVYWKPYPEYSPGLNRFFAPGDFLCGIRIQTNEGYCYGWIDFSLQGEEPSFLDHLPTRLEFIFHRMAYCTVPDYPLRVGQTSFDWGVEENESTAFATVHPNPTTGQVTITGKNLKRAEVVNTLGQRVAAVAGEGERITVDISRLPAGVYFVNVTDKDGRKCVRKVVKE